MNCFTRWAVVLICLAAGLMGGYMSWAQQEGRTDEVTVENSTQLGIGDGSGWSFPVGQWTEDKAGVISPPDERNLHSRAFYTAESYTDLTVEFEFNGNYRENGSGSAGLILRAADAGHFYFVYFPWQGQNLRAKHFWAMIAKVEGDGYLRNIKAVWVPGVPIEVGSQPNPLSHPDRWYKVRVAAQGPEISVWVNGRFALSVTDETYKSGCVGLAGYGWYHFRNIRVQGTPIAPVTWSDEAKMRAEPTALGVSSQAMPTACMAPNGDVLLGSYETLLRSRDRGRTWDEPEKIIVEIPGTTVTGVSDYGSTMFCTAEGRLFVMFWCDDTPPKIGIAESTDNGYTWPEPVPSQVPTEPEWAAIAKQPHRDPYGPLVETEDGTLLRFILTGGGVKVDNPVFGSIHTWGSTHCQGFGIRSTDGGASWSAPIELDWPKPGYPFTAQRGDIPGSLDFTEPTGVAIGNKVTVLVRPIYSPMMWQCWSDDGGATWDTAVRATFPGYAQSMIRTSSGAILCAHRFPHYSINVSYDDGVNWDAGTVIDYPSWAMGTMTEVEPDVVLVTYMNWDSERREPLLAQLIRVTPDGLYPVER